MYIYILSRCIGASEKTISLLPDTDLSSQFENAHENSKKAIAEVEAWTGWKNMHAPLGNKAPSRLYCSHYVVLIRCGVGEVAMKWTKHRLPDYYYNTRSAFATLATDRATSRAN